jgi:hypothetical protein
MAARAPPAAAAATVVVGPGATTAQPAAAVVGPGATTAQRRRRTKHATPAMKRTRRTAQAITSREVVDTLRRCLVCGYATLVLMHVTATAHVLANGGQCLGAASVPWQHVVMAWLEASFVGVPVALVCAAVAMLAASAGVQPPRAAAETARRYVRPALAYVTLLAVVQLLVEVATAALYNTTAAPPPAVDDAGNHACLAWYATCAVGSTLLYGILTYIGPRVR